MIEIKTRLINQLYGKEDSAKPALGKIAKIATWSMLGLTNSVPALQYASYNFVRTRGSLFLRSLAPGDDSSMDL